MEIAQINVSVTVNAGLQLAWDCYTAPAHIVNWNFASDDWCCPSATNDLRVGGKYAARMEAKDKSFGFDFEAIYEEVVPQQILSYRLSDRRKVEVFFSLADGHTEVVITFDAETQNSKDLQRNGWQAILNNFKKYTESMSILSQNKLQFQIQVNASAGACFDAMLGLSNKATYESWTSAFNPTSTYEGSWSKGSKILFVGTGEDGKMGGMVSRIADNNPNQFISIQHYGIIKNGIEITEGPEVEKWAGGSENYTFIEANGSTTILVDIDVIPEYKEYFESTYPVALQKLKQTIEQQ